MTSEERNEARATGRSILREARRSCGFRAPVSGAVCHLRTCIFPVIYRWQADAAGGAPARAPAAFSLHLQRRGRPDRLCLAGIARAGRMPIGADLGYRGGVGGLQRRIAREITPHPALRFARASLPAASRGGVVPGAGRSPPPARREIALLRDRGRRVVGREARATPDMVRGAEGSGGVISRAMRR